MKVTTIIGTRPEIIRLSRVIPILDRFTDHMLVHTCQNYDYELNQVFFDDLEIRRPDRLLDVGRSTAAETIGLVIAKTSEILAETRPDAVLLLGDTNSCLAAISAKRLKIPVFHMEAGNRCFDDRVPEEINRRIVDHTSDINMPYSDIAREYLLREGFPADRIIKTGSPLYEVAAYYREKIEGSDVLARLGLRSDSYFAVSCHREENVDVPEQLRKLIMVLEAISASESLPIIVAVHPRTQKRLDAAGFAPSGNIRFVKALGFSDYVHLMMQARAVLSDSGSITEEASILNLRALNIRNATERPEGMEEGTVMMTGLDVDRVLEGLRVLAAQPKGDRRLIRIVPDYSVPNVSEKVLRIILSYTGYINRVIWRKS